MKLITTSIIVISFACCNAFSDEPIKLESQFVGDKEQPAVSYFMPWQGPGTGSGLEQKQEDKYEKSIDAVDRDVMLRSMRIYDELNLEGNP
jgi:hypothetical protein